ncbi:hypothetical protein BASA62_007561 [Batrachochytrium salamandrivorans]|nr:hypothetical protein BASA62_007561 [Batrachochytrium salamandrivorans]
MKFRALVVAAMVITSVNAKWYDIFLNCFGKNRASNSGERERLLQKNEDTPQYSEATRNRGGYGLHDSDNSDNSDDSDDEEDNIYERPACDSMLATLRGLRKSISRLSREHSDGLSALCKLKDGESRSESLGTKSPFYISRFL